MGNSNQGPITNVREINESFGKAVREIARAIGEFLARVVKLRLAESLKLNFNSKLAKRLTRRLIGKNRRIGIRKI
jgi:hypothetical protein